MKPVDVIALRLRNQYITSSKLTKAEDVVGHFVAVQAQDFAGALWGVGQRMKTATSSSVEQALTDKLIVRTWPMRGTLHFVLPQDVRWLLTLLTPRVLSRAATIYRQAGLTNDDFSKGRKIITGALERQSQLTREGLYEHLERAGISTTQQRGLHILGYLAQQQLICFGPRQGKQQTFVLLDEWIPKSRILSHDESLEELARRYFKSHGPATLQDFAWWSGLPPADARKAIELSKSELTNMTIGKTMYWSGKTPGRSKPLEIALLPSYDEYTVAYKDRSPILDPENATATRNGIFSNVVIVNGRIAGIWRRTLGKKIDMEAHCYLKLDDGQVKALKDQMAAYAKFLNMDVGKLKIRQTPKKVK